MSEKNVWFKLSRHRINALVWIFFLLLLLGIAIVLLLFINIARNNFLDLPIFEQAIYGGISMALLGSSTFYFRKLYKACINLDFITPISEEDKIRQTGVFIYFALRPLFSIIFSLIIVFSLREGVLTMVAKAELQDGFTYAAMIFSFFGGYASGDLVDFFEKVSRKSILNFFERNKT
ncbi:MAG: hypothetical protein JNM88_01375 [Chitinophagaceae bacterium]|nr:hypothetical protein [Chitinophagaceae bacterium]